MNFFEFIENLESKWTVGKLADFFELKNGVNFSKEQRGKGMLTLDVKNMYGEQTFIAPANLYRVQVEPGPERTLREGDILFVRSSVKREGVGWASAFRKFSEPVTFCGFLIRARPNKDVFDSRFLVYYLRQEQIRDRLISSSGQVAITNISQVNLSRLPIPLPPLEEQKRIAGILDEADALRTKRREALARLDDLLQSTFLDMFGDPVTNPKGWEKVPLGDICELLNGFAFKSSDYIEKSNTLSCRMSNIRPGGFFDLKYNPRYLPDEFADQFQRYALQDGDLVIAMTDLADSPKILGVPTVVRTNGNNVLLNQRVGKLNIFKKEIIDVEFFKAVLNQPSTRAIYKKYAGGGLQINLGKKDLLNVVITFPPLDLQQRFAEIVSSVEEQKAKMRKHLEQLDDLFASLQQRAFRGDL